MRSVMLCSRCNRISFSKDSTFALVSPDASWRRPPPRETLLRVMSEAPPRHPSLLVGRVMDPERCCRWEREDWTDLEPDGPRDRDRDLASCC